MRDVRALRGVRALRRERALRAVRMFSKAYKPIINNRFEVCDCAMYDIGKSDI
jgi:hypothetical protein